MVPNFCVNLKPEKFHTVAHFKKKKFCSRLGSILCIWKEEKIFSCSFQLQTDSWYPLQSLLFFFFFLCAANLGVSTGFPVCARNSGMPRVTSVTCQLPETPWNLSEHLLHIKTKCSFLPVSPGALLWGLKPSQAYLKLVVLSGFYTHTHTHTHISIFLPFSALPTFLSPGGMPIFTLQKRKKMQKFFGHWNSWQSTDSLLLPLVFFRTTCS